MKHCNCRDVTFVYSLNSRKLPGDFSYGLETRLVFFRLFILCAILKVIHTGIGLGLGTTYTWRGVTLLFGKTRQ